MTLTKEIQFLEASVPELENYLLSKELYYPLGAGLNQMTLGNVLFAEKKAGENAAKYSARINEIRSKWAAAWSAKAERELKSRGGLWNEYLDEYRADSRLEYRLYPQNIRNRTIMTLLGKHEDETDSFLKSIFISGDFVWEKECAQNFPRDTFWYLFGTLKE